MKNGDIDLWTRIQEDDNRALKALFNLHYRSLCVYALQFSGSLPDSEDLVQRVFIALWTKRRELHIQTSLKSYLYKSVFNTYMQDARKDKKTKRSLEILKWKMLQEKIEEDDTQLLEKIERLKKLVDELPDRCKEILLLSKKEGFKNKEIAEKLGISIKTVESQIRIAYKKIRKGFKTGNLVALLFLYKNY